MGRPAPVGVNPEQRGGDQSGCAVAAQGSTMNLIVFSTLVGAPFAMLGLSTPVAPQRHCVFIIHPQITPDIFRAREGQIVFPDRPTEYPCSYAKSRTGTVIAFENQIGWRFVVRIGKDDEGTWSASKDGDKVSGHVMAPFGD